MSAWIVHYLSRSNEETCRVAGNRAAHRQFETQADAVRFADGIKKSGGLVFEIVLPSDIDTVIGCQSV